MPTKNVLRLAAASCLVILAAGNPAAAAAAAPSAQWTKARPILEAALACTSIDKFATAEKALGGAGWTSDQGVTPVTLPVELKTFGLPTQKVAVVRDGFEHIFRSYLPGVTVEQAAKAAKLKLGKDGHQYVRVTKLGVLTTDTEEGVTTLTCRVDTEG
jgi:hypothetical protein